MSALLLASVCRWVIAPYTQKFPRDFSYSANLFSIDNFYDEKEQRFSGEIFSVTKFTYEAVGSEDGTLIIRNVFDATKPSGEKIFTVSRVNGIDPFTGAHVPGKGDRDRKGFLFAPKNLNKEDFIYWHINYDTPANMKFQGEEIIGGLRVYRYACSYKADQTKDLPHLAELHPGLGVELDINLQTWIDPITGWLIKYDDNTTGWYYDINAKKRLRPWNRFHNEFNQSSIIHQLQIVKNKRSQINWLTIYLPVLFGIIALYVVASAYFFEKIPKVLRPVLIALLVFAVGSVAVFLFYRNQKNNFLERQIEQFEADVGQVIANFGKELDISKEALEIFRFDYQLYKTVNREKFAKTSNYFLKKSGSIRGFAYTPFITLAGRKGFEDEMQKQGFPDFHITERALSGEYIKAGERAFYLPLYFVEPVDDYDLALGFDLNSDPARSSAFRIARETNDLTITSPVTLIGDNDQKHVGIAMFNPVFENGPDRNKKLSGYFCTVFNLNNFVQSILSSNGANRDMRLTIAETNGSGTPIFSNADKEWIKRYGYTVVRKMSVLNREWVFSFYPAYQKQDWTLMALLAAGIFLSLAVAAIVFQSLSDNSKELRLSNERFAKVFNTSPSGNIITVLGTSIIVDANDSYTKLSGYSKEELIGKSAGDLSIISQDEQAWVRYKLAEQGFLKNEEITITTKTKKKIDILFSTETFQIKDRKFALTSIFDISDRKRAEQQFKNLIESAPDAVITIGNDGAITHWNKQAEIMFGISAGEAIGKSLGETIIPARYREKHTWDLAHFIQTGNSPILNKPIEIFALKKDQTEIPVEIKISALQLNDHYAFVGFVRDITDRKKAEDKLLQAKEELELLTEELSHHNQRLLNFAHITSHNLRSPVGNLSSLLKFYKDSNDEEDKKLLLSKFETVINHLTDTLNSLVGSLKTKQDIRRERDRLSFEEVFDKTKEILAGQILESKASISKDFSKAPEVDFPRHYLESILLNLFSNAIKYRSKERTPKIHFESDRVNGSIVLWVTDNGLGIDMQQHGHKLFGLNKTFHNHAEAKGFGLFITKTQVEAMGGTISAESEVNKGTTFTITFN